MTITCAAACRADVRLPALFDDHMVLQQGATLPVWGWADAGEKITVTFAGESASTVAGNEGGWRIDLKPVAPSAEGQSFAVRGKNELKFSDVVVGNVWLASGQSNMEFGVQKLDNASDVASQANDPQLRLFFVVRATNLAPQKQMAEPRPGGLEGHWQVCTPKLMAANWGDHGFSAVAYFFGKEMRSRTGQPVGLIGAYRGATPAQTWTSIDALAAEPELAQYVDQHQQLADHYDAAMKAWPATQAQAAADMKNWEDNISKPYEEAMAAWPAAAKQAAASGARPPARPVLMRPRPKPIDPPDGGLHGPANYFNGTIAPLIPYALAGVIWYQGEANSTTLADAVEYQSLLGCMIHDWRTRFGNPNLPFLLVQLAGYHPMNDVTIANWAWLRESQEKVAASLPHVGVATAMDVGNPKDIHPHDKADVGHRLAVVAAKLVLGDKSAEQSPAMASSTIDGSTIRVKFTNAGDSLAIGTPPWMPDGSTPTKADHLTGFLISGDDQKFVSADAKIDGDSVIVRSSAVPKPAAVRYAWADYPDGNLYSGKGLPTLPFRTDNWPPAPLVNTAIKPFGGDGDWLAKFHEREQSAQGKRVDLIFDGDSITDWFQAAGKPVWQKEYAGRDAIDFAIAGDTTQQLLFRLQAGQTKGLDPKLVVLLIGTNNTISNSPQQIADGVKTCAAEYLKACPHAHVLLLSLFPRRTPADPLRKQVDATNAILKAEHFDSRVTLLDIGDRFLAGDGSIRMELMPGLLHPSEQGYAAWADAIRPIVQQYCPLASVEAGR